nr:hypothetical protein [Mycobacterium pseudoshottsii]
MAEQPAVTTSPASPTRFASRYRVGAAAPGATNTTDRTRPHRAGGTSHGAGPTG